VIADATLDASAWHGIRKLEEALRAKGVIVSEGGGQLIGPGGAVVDLGPDRDARRFRDARPAPPASSWASRPARILFQ
jgi:hypothetical protein